MTATPQTGTQIILAGEDYSGTPGSLLQKRLSLLAESHRPESAGNGPEKLRVG